MSNPPQSGSGGGNWSNRDPGYRPLNVRDALSYLDQVKVRCCFIAGGGAAARRAAADTGAEQAPASVVEP